MDLDGVLQVAVVRVVSSVGVIGEEWEDCKPLGRCSLQWVGAVNRRLSKVQKAPEGPQP